MAKVGRPKGSDTFDPVIGTEICRRLGEGESLNAICRTSGFPPASTVRTWILQGVNAEFSARYAEARTLQAEKWAEDIVDISDEGTADVNRARLRVDTRKWLLSKLLPKKYGDNVQRHEIGGAGEFERLSDAELLKAINEQAIKLGLIRTGGSSH